MINGEKQDSDFIIVGGVHFSWAPFLCEELYKKNSNIVFVTRDNLAIDYCGDMLCSISKKIKIIKLYEYEDNTFDIHTSGLRAMALSELSLSAFEEKFVILITPNAINSTKAPVNYFSDSFRIGTNSKIRMSSLQKQLVEFGYIRCELTENHGQFSVRGGIIDVFPMLYKNPFRIDFFGDTVDVIKHFDPVSQQSINIVDGCVINVTRAVELIDDDSFESTFTNYIKDNSVFIYDFEIPLKQGENDKAFKKYCVQPFIHSDESTFAHVNSFSCNIRTQEGFDFFKLEIKKYKKNIISVNSSGVLNILSNILTHENDFYNFKIIEMFDEASDGLSIIVSKLSEGVIREDTCVYTEKEIFGYCLRVSGAKKHSSKKNFFKSYSNLTSGNYVVHKYHGVAIFDGLTNLPVDGIDHDFLCLIYKNNDKLFVPVENIDLISRYGSDDDGVELDKLGSSSWGRRREEVKKKLLVIADNLLKIAAKRKLHKIDSIEIDDEKYNRFCKGFPYIETEDQMSAISDVLDDLKNTRPMDRLVCGDVGFGKTEVALRAAFATVSSNCDLADRKQVAILAPTTILANQHYKNFVKRFDGFGIKICQMSRFVTKSQIKENITEIANGDVDVVIGTHAILSSKIKFKNLAMLIIDEEQHFGVKQKELLKSIKSDIHVLTMTATPIPRTLQMALSGIRDLSIIASPPIDRLPVKTYVCDVSSEVIKNAIDREIKRGGQVFIVAPRVEFLENLHLMVQKIVLDDNVSIRVIHGKTNDIEEVINEFCDNKFNVLISTNIIDSGIDIQNANTMIIYRSDLFGLSQLYQLRGRVGRRSKIQAYAYMFLPEKKKLTADAEKRFNVIQQLDKLGSGFTLASYDLDIRGAGNVIGDEQSGYIKEVGVELYQDMLERAILMKDSEEFSPQINIGVPILIPESYISDNNLRMATYRRIGDLTTQSDIDNLEIELSDRFGQIPYELQNLLTVIKIKLRCVVANIERIDVGKNGVLISFFENMPKSPEKIFDFVDTYKEIVKLRSDQKLIIYRKWESVSDRTKDIFKIVNLIKSLN